MERDWFRCSLRSNTDDVDVSTMAKLYGGGGHRRYHEVADLLAPVLALVLFVLVPACVLDCPCAVSVYSCGEVIVQGKDELQLNGSCSCFVLRSG